MEAMFDAADSAAACSHRPTHVEHIFLDANSRHFMARAILATPEMEAIRQYLQADFDLRLTGHIDTYVPSEVARRVGLPESVVRWVWAHE
jgi:hypothetical protein